MPSRQRDVLSQMPGVVSPGILFLIDPEGRRGDWVTKKQNRRIPELGVRGRRRSRMDDDWSL